MKTNLPIVVRAYNSEDLKQLIEVYKSAFAEYPWNEFMKCLKCGVNYGKDEVRRFNKVISDIDIGNFFEPKETVRVKCPCCKQNIEKAFCKKCGQDLTAEKETNSRTIIGKTSPYFVEYWNDKEIVSDLNNAFAQEKPIVLVAEISSKLAGFSWGYKLPIEKFAFLKGKVNSNSNYMDEIAVSSDLRQKGIGRILGQEYIDRVSKQNIEEIVLRTDTRNNASMTLFNKLGFKSLDIFDPVYRDRIYLVKSLK